MQQSTSIKLIIAGLINGIIVPFPLFWIMDSEFFFLGIFLPCLFLIFLNRLALIPNYSSKPVRKIRSDSVVLSLMLILILGFFRGIFSALENEILFFIVAGLVIFIILIHFFNFHFNTSNDRTTLVTAALTGICIFLTILAIFEMPKNNLKFIDSFIEPFSLFPSSSIRDFRPFLISYFLFSMSFNLLLIVTNITSKYRVTFCIIFVLLTLTLLFDFYPYLV